MRQRARRGSPSRTRLAGTIVPALLLCLVIKIIHVGLSLYQTVETSPWPRSAQAASATKAAPETQPPQNETLAELLQKKDRQLQEKDEELRKKEQELLLLKQEVSTRLAEVTALQQKVAKDLAAIEQREKASRDANVKQLVEVYKGMEPAKAAKLMEKLDEPVAVQIIAGMRGRSAGQILSRMEPERAARITKQLSLSGH